MPDATIASRRKHIYFYALLVLVALLWAALKPLFAGKPPENTRAEEVNELANTLFQ